ncbi:MAG: hypothetical protein JRJ45_06980 [Deltaproteobacteria bacterium]|nr:hypothetical protein [Deltaproteobacteria bacterium]
MTTKKILKGDIEKWELIRCGAKPLELGRELGRLCATFKASGCDGCPMVSIGATCGRTDSTWTAYKQIVDLYQRKNYLEKAQEHLEAGLWDTECPLLMCVDQLIMDMRRALREMMK